MPERAKPELRSSGACADIGGSFIKFAVVAEGGRCGPANLRPTPRENWPAFRAALREACADAPPFGPLSLSLAGVVDPEDGRVFSANVPCVNGRRLAHELSQDLGRPVVVANDADCMVLAEALRGAGMGHRVVFGIVLGSGVGGGLVVDGRIVGGAGGIAGEWGHGPILGIVRAGTVDLPPQPCGCGQAGCLDTFGGAHGMERLHRLLHDRPADSREICAGWARQEPLASATIQCWLDIVAGPLAVIVNVTGAGIVPVAGGLGNDVDLIAMLDRAVRQRMLRRSFEPVVVPSCFGDEASLQGAALLMSLPAGPGVVGNSSRPRSVTPEG